MHDKPTYEELERRNKDLELEIGRLKQKTEISNIIFKHANVGINLIDGETGEHVAFNEYACESLGYTREEYKSLAPWDFQLDESEESFKDRSRKIVNKGSEVFEAEHRTKSGEIRYRLVSVVPIITESKNYIHVISVDITDRKQTETALKESEGFSASLLEHSPNPILVVNPDTSIQYVNPALEKLTGYSMTEVKDTKAPFPWWTDDSRSGNIYEHIQDTSKGVSNHEKLFRKMSGEDFWVEINTVPIEQDGNLIYALTNWVDITGRKPAEETLRERGKIQNAV